MLKLKPAILTLLRMALMMTLCCTAAAQEAVPYRSVLIDEKYKSEFLTLHLNAQVQAPNVGDQVEIFHSTYATIDSAGFKDFIFGPDARIREDLKSRTPEELKAWGIRFPEHELYFDAEVNGKPISTRYDVAFCFLSIRFNEYDRLIDWYHAAPARSDDLPAEMKEAADNFIGGMANLGWDGFQFRDFYKIPGSGGKSTRSHKADPFYIGVYSRELNGIPVAVDSVRWSISDDRPIQKADEMLVMADGDGIFRIDGCYRRYSSFSVERVCISLEEALDILRKNMDYSPIIRDIPKGEEILIPEIEFCYRLRPLLRPSDPDYEIEVEARPAWRFASKTNRQTYNEFVMFIDAITGEVMD